MGSVYKGIWVDWSQGQLHGTTLTLSYGNGTSLTSFITFVLSISLAQLWRLVAYFVYRARFRNPHADSLQRQQGVLFQKSRIPGDTAWSLLLQGWHWRGKAEHSIRRSLPWACFAVVFTLLFTCASVLVPAKMVLGSMRLLARSDQCGSFTWENDTALLLKVFRDSQSAAAYAKDCYELKLNSPDCQVYAQSTLDWHFKLGVDCPFPGIGICSTANQSQPVHMFTSFLDSRVDLGINLDEQITYRSDVVCSILTHRSKILPNGSRFALKDSFGNSVGALTNTSGNHSIFKNYDLVEYDYGSIRISKNEVQNNTFSVDTAAANLNLRKPYTLDWFSYYPSNGDNNTWTPINEMFATNADITLILMAPNGVTSMAIIYDPMFLSDLRSRETWDGKAVYEAHSYAVPIGCVSRYQICNAANCSELSNVDSTFDNATYDKIGLSERQRSIAKRVYTGALLSGVNFVINTRSASALRAFETVTADNLQLGLPDNQYQKEFISWYTTGLAILQQNIYEYAANFTNNVAGITHAGPFYDTEHEMCSAQLIPQAHGTISISLLWFLTMLLIAVFIALLSWLAVPVMRRFDGRKYYVEGDGGSAISTMSSVRSSRTGSLALRDNNPVATTKHHFRPPNAADPHRPRSTAYNDLIPPQDDGLLYAYPRGFHAPPQMTSESRYY